MATNSNDEKKDNLKMDPESIPLSILEIIQKQTKTDICKIKCNDGRYGTGFFCLIPFPDKFNLLPVLITNNQILPKNEISKNSVIKFSLNNDEKNIEIKIDESRKTYSNEQYGITMIEMKKEDNLDFNTFLEIDENISKDTIKNIKSVYLIHYPQEKESTFSHGKIKDISEDGNINHLCSTGPGSYGCPILNLDNNRVIGIHKGVNKKEDCNYGTIMKLPIEKFFEEANKNKNNQKENEIKKVEANKNYIKAEIEIKNTNVKKNVRIINSFEQYKSEKKFKDTKDDCKFENEK